MPPLNFDQSYQGIFGDIVCPSTHEFIALPTQGTFRIWTDEHTEYFVRNDNGMLYEVILDPNHVPRPYIWNTWNALHSRFTINCDKIVYRDDSPSGYGWGAVKLLDLIVMPFFYANTTGALIPWSTHTRIIYFRTYGD